MYHISCKKDFYLCTHTHKLHVHMIPRMINNYFYSHNPILTILKCQIRHVHEYIAFTVDVFSITIFMSDYPCL